MNTRLFSTYLAGLSLLVTLMGTTLPAYSQDDPLLDAVREHADLIIKHGKDQWGDKKTELFVDGIHVDDFKPTIWKESKNDRVMSNFASQQVWMRTLAALSTVSGDPKYQAQATATMKDAFKYVRSPDGLMYWGGHLAYDLEKDQAWGMWNNGHEFKNHYPWYEGLHAIDEAKTKQLMESLWVSHMHDWRTMLFNRHGKITRPGKKRVNLKPKENWAYDFDANIELPIKQEGKQLSFSNAAGSLIHASLLHQKYNPDSKLGIWGLRLAERYWAMKHPKTGIGGFQFNVRKDGDKAQGQYGELLGDRAREWLILTPLHSRQITYPLALLLSADQLDQDSTIAKRFIDETVNEWVAYHKHAYHPRSAKWRGITTDGFVLPHQKMNSAGYYHASRWIPKDSNGQALHLAALAYRLRPNQDTRAALYSLLEGMDLAKGSSRRIRLNQRDNQTRDAGVLFALLELDRVEPESEALVLAEKIAEGMIKRNRVNGLFVPDDQRIWASINTPIPLAILHVIARKNKIEAAMPVPYPDRGFLHAPFKGIKSKNWGRTYDFHVFYNRTRAEPVLKRDPSTGK